MDRAWIAVVVLATAGGCSRSPAETRSAALASSEPPAVATSASQFCTILCDRSAPLHCPAAVECPSFCEEMLRTPICQAEMHAALTCFIAQPTERWRCDTNGLPTIAAGPCDVEQDGYRACRRNSN